MKSRKTSLGIGFVSIIEPIWHLEMSYGKLNPPRPIKAV